MTSPGIEPPFEAFYIESMLWHTSSAAHSIVELSGWLAKVNAGDEGALELTKEDLFDHLQNILHQAGCLSRYLFPSRKKPMHVARAEVLRGALGVDDDNPLADRGVRDALEHFDERLDVYLSEPRVGHFIPDHIDHGMPESEVPLHIFKGFYTGPLTFVLLGTPYEMAPIVNEMLRLHDLLGASAEGGGRLPRPSVDRPDL